jgi:hypothetical protein
VKLSVIKHVHCKKKGEEVGLIATKEKGKFWHDLFESRSSRGIGLGLLAFLGTSQEEGDEPREKKEKITSKQKGNQNQMQFYKSQRW